MADVNDIWEQMKREEEEKRKKNRKSNSSTLVTKKVENTVSKPVLVSKFDPLPQNIINSADEIVKHIQIYANGLNDENVGTRKKSAEYLYWLFCEQNPPLDPKVLEDVFLNIYKPIFRKFSDSSEVVKEKVMKVTIKYIQSTSELLTILPYLFPSLMERIPSDFSFDAETKSFIRNKEKFEEMKRGRAIKKDELERIRLIELSEEIRYLLLDIVNNLYHRIVELSCIPLLSSYLYNTILLVQAGTVDPYPNVRILSFHIIDFMLQNIPNQLKYYCVALIKSLYPSIRHHLFKVRDACLSTLLSLIMYKDNEKVKGAGSECILEMAGFQDPNIIPVTAFYTDEHFYNYFALLIQDENPKIRLHFISFLGEIMIKMPDRYDYLTYMSCYLLSGLIDEIAEIRVKSYEILSQLGKLYEEDNSEHIIEKKQYGVDGVIEHNNNKNILQYPHPFNGRPPIGMRYFVQEYAKRFIPALLSELQSWKEDIQIRSVKLLMIMIIFCEVQITQEMSSIINVLNKVIKIKSLHNQILTICHVIGYFTSSSSYIKLLLPFIDSDERLLLSGNIDERMNAVIILYNMLLFTDPHSILPSFPDIVNSVTNTDLISSENRDYKDILLQFYVLLFDCLGEKGESAVVGAVFDKTGRLEEQKSNIEKIINSVRLISNSEEEAEQIIKQYKPSN